MHARLVSQVHALNRLKGMDPDFPARPDPWPSPSERVWAEFLAVLDALPPSARVAFMLYDVFGADYEDISRVLGLPLHACRAQVEQARACAHEHARSLADAARKS